MAVVILPQATPHGVLASRCKEASSAKIWPRSLFASVGAADKSAGLHLDLVRFHFLLTRFSDLLLHLAHTGPPLLFIFLWFSKYCTVMCAHSPLAKQHLPPHPVHVLSYGWYLKFQTFDNGAQAMCRIRLPEEGQKLYLGCYPTPEAQHWPK